MNRFCRTSGADSLPIRHFVFAAFVLLAPANASAHDLKLDVNAAADPIRVVAGYDDGMPAEGARVEVADEAGIVVAEGLLDDKGTWTFARPGPGSYAIVVEQAGHRDGVRLVIPEDPVEPPGVFSRERLDKNLGLIVGLALLLGGTLAFVYLRRSKRTGADARPV